MTTRSSVSFPCSIIKPVTELGLKPDFACASTGHSSCLVHFSSNSWHSVIVIDIICEYLKCFKWIQGMN